MKTKKDYIDEVLEAMRGSSNPIGVAMNKLPTMIDEIANYLTCYYEHPDLQGEILEEFLNKYK